MTLSQEPIRFAISPKFCDKCGRKFIFEFYKKRFEPIPLIPLLEDENVICGRCLKKEQKDESTIV